MMRRALRLCLLPLLIAGGAAPEAAAAPTVTVAVGDARLHAEVAATPEAHRRGLMGREHLGADSGMLFVWRRSGSRTFWMKNTPLPLSVAFLDDRGRILNIEAMAPLREDRHYRSRGAARFALEANRGWFRRHGVEPGDRCRFRIPAGLLPARERGALVVGAP
ncbi:DUF192 domain-containing protein [Thiohalorhabdus methylotrophus]|uniref:DUF192 domain-containing protein n=1 Tax=Thiohalorhabdus methylotrophus TaxID=3242694 RepID=A0ABV4TUP8_9GAMM